MSRITPQEVEAAARATYIADGATHGGWADKSEDGREYWRALARAALEAAAIPEDDPLIRGTHRAALKVQAAVLFAIEQGCDPEYIRRTVEAELPPAALSASPPDAHDSALGAVVASIDDGIAVRYVGADDGLRDLIDETGAEYLRSPEFVLPIKFTTTQGVGPDAVPVVHLGWPLAACDQCGNERVVYQGPDADEVQCPNCAAPSAAPEADGEELPEMLPAASLAGGKEIVEIPASEVQAGWEVRVAEAIAPLTGEWRKAETWDETGTPFDNRSLALEGPGKYAAPDDLVIVRRPARPKADGERIETVRAALADAYACAQPSSCTDWGYDEDVFLAGLAARGLAVVPVGEPDGMTPPGMVAAATEPALALHYAVNACMRGKRYLTTHVTGDTMSLLEDSGWRLTRSDAAGGGNDAQ